MTPTHWISCPLSLIASFTATTSRQTRMYARTDTHRINIHRRGLGVSPQETESIFYPVFLGHVSGLPDQVPLWLDFIAVMFKGFWLLLLWQAFGPLFYSSENRIHTWLMLNTVKVFNIPKFRLFMINVRKSVWGKTNTLLTVLSHNLLWLLYNNVKPLYNGPIWNLV